MTDAYLELIDRKRIRHTPTGFDVAADGLNPDLFEWQRRVVSWALKRGRAAVFADCGLGKTAMQLEWAHRVHQHAGRPVLVLAPLAVAAQTQREGEKFGIDVTVCRDQRDVVDGINVTNFEMLARFDPATFGGLVLDESSILKAYTGTTRNAIQSFADAIAFRLACTATPAPNDVMEMTNHSEFVGSLQGKQILSLFMQVDYKDGSAGKQSYVLKQRARRAYYEWLASWAIALRRPSDANGSDDGFVLPPLEVVDLVVDAESAPTEGQLFALEASTLQERNRARRDSIDDRVARVAELVAADPDEPWIVWCGLNDESQALTAAIPGAVEITGSDHPDVKAERMAAFSRGDVRVLVTKPSIAGWGMNWQHCARVAFLGLSDSWEQYYQAVRRCYRFGQQRTVRVYRVTASTEGAVLTNIERKERQAAEMMDGMVDAMGELTFGRDREPVAVKRDTRTGDGWTMHLGDSVQVLDELDDGAADMALFSPPFPGMYMYTDTPFDIGNTSSMDEMIEHFRFVAAKMRRVVKPGRLCCIHLMQLPAYGTRDGFQGIIDYRGRVIAMMLEEGWRYASEVTIDKDPQRQARAHKEHGLLYKTLATDSTRNRQALADYLLVFRNRGENAEPVRSGIHAKYQPDGGWITQDEWIEWAAPVWYRHTPGIPGGIRETDVLTRVGPNEERHLCPLQQGVIERAVKLWSNPGDVVLSPFGGIGSEGVGSLRFERRFLGIELNEAYWQQACRNLETAASPTLLDGSAA
ncbi:MAG: helicase [Spirochaetes bacterium]|nr:MAG: helicase [Spirochaetota bacterium]